MGWLKRLGSRPQEIDRDFVCPTPRSGARSAWRDPGLARADLRTGGPDPKRNGTEGLQAGRALKFLGASLWPLGVGAAILVAYGLACAVAASPLFVLQEVTVDVSGRPSPTEIETMSGIRPGMNLLSLDTEEVSRRLETHRWIQHATVVKRLPDQILIKVQERRPVAVLGIHGIR